ncbi:MAG TPA: hypothetical protein PLP01_10215 [Phycisphaerae bacterium]|nr:hypothetical protein [Phycisphaerae bacterium]
MLLRLGHGDLAERVWFQWYAGRDDKAQEDRYLDLATDWVWALYDRAVTAHMRGDDQLALVSARALSRVKDSVEAEAGKRGLRKFDDRYLNFLGNLPDLLADSERRLNAPKRVPALEAGLYTYPDKAARIRALIADLENVVARQYAQPGGVELWRDETIIALTQEGTDAVEPLIQCIENDNRLTRSVTFSRDFSRDRDILHTHDAAYAALTQILSTVFYDQSHYLESLTRKGERQEVAQAIRKYWKARKGLQVEEWWYRSLADDNATAAEWGHAAWNITQPLDSEGTQVEGVVVRRLQGEALRDRKNPDVASLMNRRMRDLAERTGGDWQSYVNYASAICVAKLKWEGKAGLDDARWLTQHLERRLAEGDDPHPDILARAIARCYLARLDCDDERAADGYAHWLKQFTWTKSPFAWEEVLEPIWRHPDSRVLADVSDFVFTSPDSPVAAAMRGPQYESLSSCSILLRDRALICPGLQKLARGLLSDTAPFGAVTVREDGRMDVTDKNGESSSEGRNELDPLAPPAGTVVQYRVCDYVAHELATQQGTPDCQLYWSDKERDKAVAACAEFLSRYGSRYRQSPEMKRPERRRVTDYLLALPSPNGVASPSDVEQGRSIFSLDGQGQRRPVALPQYPMAARWTSLKTHPHYAWQKNSEGEFTKVIAYYQDGVVWQAEEMLREGQWARYYRFVGEYDLARVPADEIEFSAGENWTQLSRGLDCLAGAPGIAEPDCEEGAVVAFSIGDPVVVGLWLYNRKGTDQAIPSTYSAKRPEQETILGSGIKLQLLYTPGDIILSRDGWGNRIGTDIESRPWQAQTPKVRANAEFHGEEMLPAGHTRLALEIDLREFFDLTAPGSYRLKFIFSTEDSGFADGESNEVLFSLSPQSTEEETRDGR